MLKNCRYFINQLLTTQTLHQLKRFLITGGVGTIISYTTFSVSIRVFSTHYIIANFIAFCFGIVWGYNFNKRWSFGGSYHKNSHILEYLMVYLSSLGISTLVLKIGIGFFGIVPEIAFLISLCITTCTNFLGIKFLVFKK